MSKSRDIADSAATINFIDGVTSNVQTQLNTATTAIAANTTAIGNISVTNGSQTKTYANNETSTIALSAAITSGAPVVSVTKEVPQTGATNNDWDAAAASYTLENSAPATTLSWAGAFDISNSASVYSVPEGPVVIAPLRAFTCAPKMILPVQFANELSGATLKSTIPL